ncbi:MAG: hypothetical protein AB7D96_02185 [Arcobacteraceae bacterium]
MENLSFTDDQLLNLVNNTILQKTEFTIDEFTGGSVGITSTNNNTQTNYRVSLFFGYANKKPITRNIVIEKDTYYIWAKALMLKAQSIKNDNLGMNYSDLNTLMNSTPTGRPTICNSIKYSRGRSTGRPTNEEETEKFEKLNEMLLNKQVAKDKQNMRLESLAIQKEEIEF